ncbi:MAG: DUF3053 domain-containing protein [Alphaproteobacteria bacterium]|nr:DUF3053 domain-containing protein [Alphaproteobacteria bacterium]
MFSSVTRRFAVLGSLCLALVLSGCGDKEPEQRKAFISFLQDRIVSTTRNAVPVMTDKDKEALGAYAAHYDVIFNFNRAMTEATKEFDKVTNAQGKLSNMQQLQSNWQQLSPLREQLSRVGDTLTAERKKADDLRVGLKQPDELKEVYEKAYAKLVTAPAKGFTVMLPALQNLLQETENVGRFLSDNKASVKFVGSAIQVQDEALLAKWKELQTHYMGAVQRLLAAMAEIAKG